MDDYKFRMVEMMHLYLSGMITDEEMQELQDGWMWHQRTGLCLIGFVRERIFYTSTGCTKKLTIE